MGNSNTLVKMEDTNFSFDTEKLETQTFECVNSKSKQIEGYSNKQFDLSLSDSMPISP